jgi:hypothetical protein
MAIEWDWVHYATVEVGLTERCGLHHTVNLLATPDRNYPCTSLR